MRQGDPIMAKGGWVLRALDRQIQLLVPVRVYGALVVVVV